MAADAAAFRRESPASRTLYSGKKLKDEGLKF